jgi:predicted transcriptional regulator
MTKPTGKPRRRRDPSVWTLDRHIDVIQRKNNGQPYTQIAKEMGLSYAAVSNYISKLMRDGSLVPAIEKNPWQEEEKEELEKHYFLGWDANRIAAQLNRTMWSVRHQIRQMGLERSGAQEERAQRKKDLEGDAKFVARMLAHHPELERRI